MALLVAALLPATAAEAVPPCEVEDGDVGCGDGTPGDDSDLPGGPPLGSDGGGFPCDPGCTHIRTTSAQLPPPGECFQIVQGTGWPTYGAAAAFAAVATGLPPCPGQHDPAADIAALWRGSRAIPSPTATIEPGTALTGLPAYLVVETPSELDITLTSDATGITYELTLETDYEVDWGDGTVDSGIDRSGEPYPGGPDEITHVYDQSGTVDVVVRAEWTGTWRLAGTAQEQPLSGSVPREHRMEDFPVDQVQAVRRG